MPEPALGQTGVVRLHVDSPEPVQVQSRQLQAAVGLIGAVGGGWSNADLPTPKQTIPFNPLALHHSPGNVSEPN